MKRRKPQPATLPGQARTLGAPSLRVSSGARVGDSETFPASNSLVEIEKPIYGGAFLARLEGKAVFVPLTLPGEQARIRITQSKSGYATAEVVEIVRAAPSASLPPALTSAHAAAATISTPTTQPNSSSSSPSCAKPWSAAAFDVPEEIAILAADPWPYRNRIRLAFDAAGNLGYRGRRSHAVIPIARMSHRRAACCLRPLMPLAEIAKPGSPSSAPHGDCRSSAMPPKSALLVTFFTAEPTPNPQRFASNVSRRLFTNASPLSKARNSPPEAAPASRLAPLRNGAQATLTYPAAGFDYRVDHGAFFQVNRWLVDGLVEQVTAGQQGKLAWDLFAGVGLFARKLPAASSAWSPSSPRPLQSMLSKKTSRAQPEPRSSEATLDFLRRAAQIRAPRLDCR